VTGVTGRSLLFVRRISSPGRMPPLPRRVGRTYRAAIASAP
jgi:hypothetical protein